MNTHEALMKLIMESYDRGVDDAKQAAIEGIQKAILLEREECADAVRFADNGTEAAEIIRARRKND